LAQEPNEPNKLNEPNELKEHSAETMVAEATQALTERVATLEAEVATKTGELNELRELNKLAVEDYRKLVLQTNPLFTPDIIVGDTIEELKSSVEKANLFVAKIKTQIQAKSEYESESSRVPAGAPVRGAISTEGLSAKEKINLGLEQARKRKE
jgi:hypothetical protein